MRKKLEEALNAVEMTYADLVEIANDMSRPAFAQADKLVADVNDRINALSVDQIRDSMLRLQLEAYRLSEIKDKAQLKADLADALEKEKYAVTFNSLEGAATVKDKLTQAEIADETISEVLYGIVAALFKTKVDQLHRLISVLTSILMSKMQETKFMNMGVADDASAYKTKREEY